MEWFWILIGVLVILLLIILIFRFWCGPSKSQEDVQREFVDPFPREYKSPISSQTASYTSQGDNISSNSTPNQSLISERSWQVAYACPRPFVRNPSRGERACRAYLEERFGMPFQSCRPPFLKNPETGMPLELDCYQWNLPIPIAVEYQGQQHYRYTPYFHKSEKDFIEQRRKDIFKANLCARVGVYLIRVPYDINEKDIGGYIEERLPKKLITWLNEEKIDRQE